MSEPKRRLRPCVEAWPGAETGAYDPRCCRFPKSCSATIYDPERVTEDDLESDVVRVDKYRVRVGAVTVVATTDQERQIQDMTTEQRARFVKIMGG